MSGRTKQEHLISAPPCLDHKQSDLNSWIWPSLSSVCQPGSSPCLPGASAEMGLKWPEWLFHFCLWCLRVRPHGISQERSLILQCCPGLREPAVQALLHCAVPVPASTSPSVGNSLIQSPLPGGCVVSCDPVSIPRPTCRSWDQDPYRVAHTF